MPRIEPGRRADETAQARYAVDPHLKEEYGESKQKPNDRRDGRRQSEWMKMVARGNAGDGEDRAHHELIPPGAKT